MDYRVPPYITVVKNEAAPRQDVQRVVVHAAVTEIAEDAFRDWTSLADVAFELGSQLETVGAHAFMGTALERFDAPRGLKAIHAGAFMNCGRLKVVMLNEGLELLGKGVFQNSGVETIYFPSTLLEMRKGALLNCKNLQKVLVAEGCKVNVKRCVWSMVSVETVSKNTSDGEGSSSVQIEVEDEEGLRGMSEERDMQIDELQ